jgi:hypothetical protein
MSDHEDDGATASSDVDPSEELDVLGDTAPPRRGKAKLRITSVDLTPDLGGHFL